MQDMHFLLEDFICGHISRKTERVPDRLRQRMDKLRLQRVRKDRTGWVRVCICISGKWKLFFFSFMSLLWWWFLLWQSICAVWLWKKCRKSVVSLWGLQPWLCCGWYSVAWFTGCSQPLWKLTWCKYNIDMDNRPVSAWLCIAYYREGDRWVITRSRWKLLSDLLPWKYACIIPAGNFFCIRHGFPDYHACFHCPVFMGHCPGFMRYVFCIYSQSPLL